MRTRLFVLVIALALVATLAFGEGQREEEGPVELVWSSVSVPNDAHTQAMMEFEKVVEDVSGGEIQVEVAHSGELFTQEEAQAAVRRGTVDIVYTGPNWLAQYVPYNPCLPRPTFSTATST